MFKIAKLCHLIGLVMLLGGILGSVVLNAVVGGSTDSVLLHHQRQFVSGLTWALTLPGMWIAILTGLIMVGIRKYNLRRTWWLTIKAALAVVIVINAVVVLTPLVSEITSLAAQSALQGTLLTDYLPLKRREDLFGTVNFCLILIVIGLAVFKPGRKNVP